MPISINSCLKRGRVFLLGFISISFMALNLNAQEMTPAYKVALIYKFAQNVQWENEEEIDTFRIGIYGTEIELMREMKKLTSFPPKGNSFTVTPFSRLNEVTRTHVLYVARNRNSEIERIAARILSKVPRTGTHPSAKRMMQTGMKIMID